MKKRALALLVADQENVAQAIRRTLATAGVPTLHQFEINSRAGAGTELKMTVPVYRRISTERNNQ